MKLFGIFLFLLTFTFTVMAQVVLPASVDAAPDYNVLIGQAIANPKAFSVIIIVALLVFGTVQALKAPRLKSFFKFIPEPLQFLVILVLGQAYAGLIHVFILKDQQMSVFLVGLLSSGSAASIYNAIIMVFGKKKASQPIQ